MSNLVFIEKTGVIMLPEVMTLKTLPGLLRSKKILELAILEVDFRQVKVLDSSVLALILTWSSRRKISIRLANVPEQIKILIELYNLENSTFII